MEELASRCETGYSLVSSLRWDPTLNNEEHPNDLIKYHLDRLLESASGCQFIRAYEVLASGEEGNPCGSLAALELSINKHFASPGFNTKQVCKLRILVDNAGKIHLDSTPLEESSEVPYLFLPVKLVKSWDGLGNMLIEKSSVALAPGYVEHPHLGRPFNIPSFDTQKPLVTCKVYLDSKSTSPSVFTTHKTTHRPMYDASRTAAKIEHVLPLEAEVLLHNSHGEIMEASVSTPYFYRGNCWVTPAISSGGNAGVTRRLALEGRLCEERVVMRSELQNGEIIWLSNAVRGFWRGKLDMSERSEI